MATKAEIIEKLVEASIAYDADATKAELEALLPEGTEEIKDQVSVGDELGEVEEGESDAKTAFRNHLRAYRNQNPKKFEGKKEALLAKLNTL